MNRASSFFRAALAAPALLLAAAGCERAAEPRQQAVTEYAIDYPGEPNPPAPGHGVHAPGGASHPGSTHEIAYDERSGALWISGQNHDSLARVRLDADGRPRIGFQELPPGSGPHGIAFDAAGNRWVTLEFTGRIVAFDRNFTRIADHDVRLDCGSCPEPINSHPHGLGIGPDGRTIWFTGKATGTIGRIAPDGTVQTFALPTAGSTPIYIRAGADGNMWVTELTGNQIARVTPDGHATEFPIPTPYSRPIAIVPGPDGNMWFTEEAGGNVARITPAGVITEFPLPRAHPNRILAGLAFDGAGNLWVQHYVDHNRPEPGGEDGVFRIDRAGLAGAPAGLGPEHIAFFPAPTRDTVMHRILAGPGGAMWFTELRADRLGRIAVAAAAPARR
jgi:virginiamycin B lyase